MSSVPTTLGGGNHGYLGIILTSAEYHRIVPANPLTRPPNPGVLVPNPSGTAAQISSAEDTHCLTTKTLSVGYLNRVFVVRQCVSFALEIWAAVPDGFETRTPGFGGRVKG